MRLNGKVAIVTGGSSGLGRAIAGSFGAEGARVVVACRRSGLGDEVVTEIQRRGGMAVCVETDVSRSTDVVKLVEQTVATFGRVDLLVNNAGIHLSRTRVTDLSEDDWDAMIDVNLKGVFLCSKFAIPEMIKTGGGTIINISSVTSLIGMKDRAAISATKGGVNSLARSMAIDYGPYNVRVNTICPSLVETEMTAEFLAEKRKVPGTWEAVLTMFPLRTLGTPQDVAAAAVFLASDESRWITGATLVLDGGHTVS